MCFTKYFLNLINDIYRSFKLINSSFSYGISEPSPFFLWKSTKSLKKISIKSFKGVSIMLSFAILFSHEPHCSYPSRRRACYLFTFSFPAFFLAISMTTSGYYLLPLALSGCVYKVSNIRMQVEIGYCLLNLFPSFLPRSASTSNSTSTQLEAEIALFLRSCYQIPWCGLYRIKIYRKRPDGANLTFLFGLCVL